MKERVDGGEARKDGDGKRRGAGGRDGRDGERAGGKTDQPLGGATVRSIARVGVALPRARVCLSFFVYFPIGSKSKMTHFSTRHV
jgi:hypothetical protein